MTHVKFPAAPVLFQTCSAALLCAALSCGRSCGYCGHGKSALADTVTVVAYNVENLFDYQTRGSEFPDFLPEKSNWSIETCQKKIVHIAAALTASGGDILVLSEVENIRAAKMVQTELRRLHNRFPYCVTGEKPNPATTCEAILSRYPIVHSQGHGLSRTGEYFTRNILEADIAIGAHLLKIFAVHFPSKRYQESYRIAAVDVLMKRLRAIPAGTDYILAGDFNCNYNEAESFTTEGLDNTGGRTAINHCLKTALSSPGQRLRFASEQDVLRGSAAGLHFDPWLEVPQKRRFSYSYLGAHNTLDHILLPPALFDSAGISYCDDSFGPFTWQGRLLYDNIPYRWKTRRTGSGIIHDCAGYSDHLPVIARFFAGPFFRGKSGAAADSATTHNPDCCHSGFETGMEGWLPCSARFRLIRESTCPAKGMFCLKIDGVSTTGTGAAHIRFPFVRAGITRPEKLSCMVRGTGRCALRLRYDSGPWYCAGGENFSRMTKNTRYANIDLREWRQIRLSLPAAYTGAETLEVQIRSAAEYPLSLQIDDVRLE